MRIKEVVQCGVIVQLTPGDCLLLAEACHLAGLESTDNDRHAEKQVFGLAGAHLEGLALLGAAQGLVVENQEFLRDLTLTNVREDWAIAGEKKAAKERQQ
jgi:hypothetical protein